MRRGRSHSASGSEESATVSHLGPEASAVSGVESEQSESPAVQVGDELTLEQAEGLLSYAAGLRSLSGVSGERLEVRPASRGLTALETEVVDDVTNILALAISSGMAANESVHLSIEAWTQADEATRNLCEARALWAFRRGGSFPVDITDDDSLISYVNEAEAPTPHQIASRLRDYWALAASLGLSPYEVGVVALAHAEMLVASTGFLLVGHDHIAS
jgi:hypothetical protein